MAISGALRKIRGALVTAISLRESELSLCLPSEKAEEAAMVPGVEVLPAHHLLDVMESLCGQSDFDAALPQSETTIRHAKDICEVKGQVVAKQALVVAAAGGHNILLYGPQAQENRSANAEFAATLQEIKENIIIAKRESDEFISETFRTKVDLDIAIAGGKLIVPKGVDVAIGRAKELHKAIPALKAGIQKSLDDTEQLLVDKELPVVIQERHTRFAEDLEAKLAEDEAFPGNDYQVKV